MTFAPGFGVLLRGFRREAALTQETLAERADLSVEAVRLLEAGRRRHPRPATVSQLVTALGLSEADRSRLADAARRRQAALHDLPPDIEDFAGRAGELDQLIAALTGTAAAVSLVSVAGMGGVGKTALAVHGARLLNSTFPDGCLYLSLGGHGGEPAPPLELLRRLLRALGVDEEQIPAEVDPAAARYRSALAGRKVLVLLDDAASSEQVAPLIPGTSGSAALITSRKQLTGLAGVHQLRLDVLPDADALELLSTVLGSRRIEAERADALTVVRLCGHLPLALRIASGYLAGQPGKTLGQLAAELETSRAEVLSADGGGVRASIELSVRALAGDPRPVAQLAAEVFPVAALLGADDFALRAAAAAMDRPIGEVEGALEHLVDVGLLETPQLHRYHLHDLVRESGRELAGSALGWAGIAAVRGRILDYYLALAWRIDEHAQPSETSAAWRRPEWTLAAKDLEEEAAIDLLDADRANLVAAVEQAALGSAAEQLTVVRIAAGLNAYGPVRKRWGEWRAVLEAAAGIVGRLDDPIAAGMIHFDLGLVHDELDDFDLAAEQLALALGSARRTGPVGFEVQIMVNLAHALERADRLIEARAVLLEHGRHEGRELIDGGAWADLVLGMISGKEKDLDGQRSAFELALERFRAAGTPPRGLAVHLRTIGESYTESGEYEPAEAAFQAALSYREEANPMNVAAILEGLGSVYVSSGRLVEAETVLAEALVLAKEQQQWDCEARIRVALGRRLAALGRTAEAEEAWRQALGIYERHGAAAAQAVRELLA